VDRRAAHGVLGAVPTAPGAASVRVGTLCKVEARARHRPPRVEAGPAPGLPGLSLQDPVDDAYALGHPYEARNILPVADLKQVTLSITRNCNLACAWCFKDAQSWSHDLLTTWDIFRVLETVSAFAEGVTFTGGEPFLRKDLRELILKAISLKFTTVAITTNGLAIRKGFEQLLRDESIVLGVSIDGNEARHDFVRGPGTFARTIARIKELTSIGIRVVLLMTVSGSNLSSVRDLLDLGSELGVLGMSFQRLRCIGRGRAFQDKRLTFEELRVLARELALANRENHDFFIDFKDPFRNVLSRKAIKRLEHVPQNFICGGCRAGNSYVYIAEDGTIQPCAFLNLALGNILKDDLVEIWESSRVLKKLRTRMCYEACRDCRFWNICRGCRADAYTAYGSYLAADPLCCKGTPQTARPKEGVTT
jgi:AdoMet-dependent heme synthase